MLSLFRRGGVAQILVGGIVVAIIVVFVLEFRAGGKSQGGGGFTQECAIQVYGRCTTPKEFTAAVGLVVPMGLETKMVKQMDLHRHVMDGLAERELLVTEANRLGLEVGDDYLTKELMAGRARVSLPVSQAHILAPQLGLCVPNAYRTDCDGGMHVHAIRNLPVRKDGRFNQTLYERRVRTTTGRGPKEFRTMQHAEVLAARLRDLVRSRVRVPEAEAFRIYSRERSQVSVRYVEVSREWLTRYAVVLVPEAVEQWAKENSAQVDEAWKAEKDKWKEGCILASEIRLPFTAATTDEDKVELRTRVDAAHRRITKDKEKLETLAREETDAAAVALAGNIGCLSEESYGVGAKELLEAAADLGNGKVSPVLETPRGFHILRVDGKLAAADVERKGRQLVAQRLAAQFKANELAEKLSRDLIERGKSGAQLDSALAELLESLLGISPEQASADPKPKALASAIAPSVKESPLFGIMTSPIQNALPTDNPAAAAFALKKPGEMHPELIHTTTGYAVLQLKEQLPAKREDFEKEKTEVVWKLRELKERDALIEYVGALRKRAGEQLKINRDLYEKSKNGQDAEQ